MQHIKNFTLAALFLAASLQNTAVGKRTSTRQPFPEAGFWVTETTPGESTTRVKYYANSNHFVSESIEPGKLDVSKLSVRKYLNSKLKTELAKDSTIQLLPKLYEIR
jgi:hypothetical protein